MRLAEQEVQTLKTVTFNIDADAQVFLFGSRVDDAKKGGDIDILILSNVLKRENIRKIKRAFFDLFGEQKLDIVLDELNPKKVFTKMIVPKAVKL